MFVPIESVRFCNQTAASDYQPSPATHSRKPPAGAPICVIRPAKLQSSSNTTR